MTYERIYDLKFNKKLPTYKLGKRFPHDRKKISRVALLQLPLSTLKTLLDRKEFRQLASLKRWLVKKASC